MVSVTSASRFQCRSSMYYPRSDFTELAEAVQIGILLYVGPEIYSTNLSFHMAHMTLYWLCLWAAKFKWNILINLYLKL